MSDNDFSFLMGLAVFTVLWVSLNGMYVTGEIDRSNLPNYEEKHGILATMSMATSFMNPFSDNFNSDFFYVNILIFPLLGFGLLLVAVRYIRGQ